MFRNILSTEQQELIPFVQCFKREYYLVGGTAIALQIGHRQSIDFDLFKFSNIQQIKINQRLIEFKLPYQLLFADSQSFHILAHDVKLTFFQFPFKVPTKPTFEGLKMPDLLHLAAMKAYALGRRAKWKDYIDLYFILKNYHSLDEICDVTQRIFGNLFSPKLLRQQLCYYKDIDYTEEVFYMENHAVSDDEIKQFLTDLATKTL
jgi:hypothetical protein